MWRHSISGSLLGVSVAAAVLTSFAIVRRRRQRQRIAATAARLRYERWVGIEDELDPELDSENLQWRPRTGSSLAGPEDLEPLELDFEEFDDTDVASAAVTIDMVGGTDETTINTGSGGGEPSQQSKSRRGATPGRRRRSLAQGLIDELDWLDELDDPQAAPPHRYR